MAFFDTTWYVNFGDGSTTGYYAVAKRPQNVAVAAGQIVRQFTAPAVGNERCYICFVAGTTANTVDATWSVPRGSKVTDGTAQWIECTGITAVNGDFTNTLTWTQVKALGLPTTGTIIRRNNGASYQIVTVGAALGASEPAFSDVAGTTTLDGSATWTSLGPVGNFTGGQAPHARLNNVFGTNWFASGNTVYVGNNHAETQNTGMTLSPASALMAKILCHTASGPYPPTTLTTGATVTTAGTNSITLGFAGSVYIYGVTFSSSSAFTVGGSTVPQVHNWYYFDNCSLQSTSVSASPSILFGNAAAATWSIIILDNTTVKVANAGTRLVANNTQLTWKNTGQILAAGSAIPAELFHGGTTIKTLTTVLLEGLDLSQLTGSLWYSDGIESIGNFTIKDCKLNAATTVATPINTGMVVQNSRSASGATPYVSSRHTYEGVETTETSIVRTGGFTDPAGQAQSRRIVTTANTQWLRPYAAQPMAVWNGDVGSPKTVTVYGLSSTGALPAIDEVWLEISGLTNASFPVGSMVTSGKDNVWDAGGAGTSDSSTWAIPATTFDGTNALVALSNGNLTVTHNVTTANAGALSTAYRSYGKYYFELVIQNSISVGIYVGVLSSAAVGNFGTVEVAQQSTTVVLGTSTNVITNGNTGVLNFGNAAVGDRFCLAIDLTNRLVWVRKENGNWNLNVSADPATGVGGLAIASTLGFAPYIRFATSASTTDTITTNFGATAYTYTPPSGFGKWAEDGHVPFKLVVTLTPQMAGTLIPQVKVAKASTTVYIDPLAVVT